MARTRMRGNGTGTAIKRGRTWTARVVIGWKVDGDPPHRMAIYRTKGGFKSKKEALAYCPILYAEQERRKEAPSVAFYWEAYKDGEMEKLSDSKKTAYRIAWEKMESIKNKHIDALTVADLRKLVSEKADTFYPARDMKTVLSHLFKLAGADGYVNKDLPDYIILPKLKETERQPFTEEEQTNLWKAYEGGCRNAAIPLLMIYSGMMPGELRMLTVDMIDYENQQIIGAGLKTKVRRESAIYLPSSIIPLLQEAAEGKTGRIWTCNEDKFYELYYGALEAAGCRKLTPYSCRHTTATALAITEGIAPQTIKKIMRWSTTKMLDRYAHPSDADARTAIETFNKNAPTGNILVTSTPETA